MARWLWLILVAAGPLGSVAFGQTVEGQNRETVRAAAGAPAADGADAAAAAKQVVEKTNAFRKAEGHKAVAVSDKLTETARYFAGYMARTGEYGHEADGKKPSERVKDHGYDYCVVAENIAYVFDPAGFTTEKLADQFTTGWKNSPHHRKNMLDPDVTETGVAIARSEKTGYYYAVQLFGRPKSAAIEFSVANEADTAVEYTIGEDTFTLPPRYTRTHTLCRSADLTFRWPDGKDEKAKGKTVTPAAGDKFVVTHGDAGWKAANQPAHP